MSQVNLDSGRQAEIMKSFERGRRLYQLVNSQGWTDFLDIAEAEVVKAEFRLMNVAAGSTSELVRDLLAHARAARSNFEQIQLRVNAEIESGLEATLNVTTPEADYNNL